MEYEMIDMDDFDDHNKEIKQAELDQMHETVLKASSASKTNLKLHSIKSLDKNIKQILEQYLSTAESLT